MSNFVTPMLDVKSLPPVVKEWFSHRLMKEENVRLIFQDASDGTNCQFYFLTTQKLIILMAEHPSGQVYNYRSHQIYFLENIYGIRVEAKLEAYGSNVDARVISFQCGGNDAPSIRLDPQAADKFEEMLLSLLFDLKDAWT